MSEGLEKSFSKENLQTVLMTWFLTFLLFFFSASLFSKFTSHSHQGASNLHHSEVSIPVSKPDISQESIDHAIEMFGIRLPRNVEGPVLDTNLKDRGITIRTLISEKAVVRIGPNAFDSWALLGSTLAHEIEVHCVQDYGSIFLMDMLGLGGINYAEIQAYNYELANASRFGLNMSEIESIFETKHEYIKSDSKVSMENISKYSTFRETIFTAFFSKNK